MFIVEWFFCCDGIIPDSGLTGLNNTHTHTHTHTHIYIYIYIYIYVCVCVCVCVCVLCSIYDELKIFFLKGVYFLANMFRYIA